jgi:AraC-like DNA-binding protein
VLQGRGYLEAPQETYNLKAGDCFILRGDEQYRAGHEPDDPLTVMAIHFDFLDAGGNVVMPTTTRLHRRIENLDFFVNLLERLESAWMEGAREREEAHIWFEACLAELERQDGLQRRRGHTRRQGELIRAMCRAITYEPAGDYSIDHLASRLGCSRQHFARLFRQLKGCSTREFIIRIRIESAKGLLLASNYSVSRIADLCGFGDVYYFSRQFKQRTGMSPTHYRKQGPSPHTTTKAPSGSCRP